MRETIGRHMIRLHEALLARKRTNISEEAEKVIKKHAAKPEVDPVPALSAYHGPVIGEVREQAQQRESLLLAQICGLN